MQVLFLSVITLKSKQQIGKMNMTGLDCSLRKQMTFNLLGPDIHSEIILTDLPYIFIVLGEFVRRSKQFPFGDHFINSYNLNSCLYIDIVRKNLILVTLGT